MYWDQHNFLSMILFSPLLPILLVWEIVWKSVAMWKAARHNQLFWFIALTILNTVGILPIVYILFFQNDINKPKSSRVKK
jgi:hypothetical protein